MAFLLQKRASEIVEQLRFERHEWDSELAALQLQVATGKEHAKVCCPHTVVYHPVSTRDIKYICTVCTVYQAVSRDVHQPLFL